MAIRFKPVPSTTFKSTRSSKIIHVKPWQSSLSIAWWPMCSRLLSTRISLANALRPLMSRLSTRLKLALTLQMAASISSRWERWLSSWWIHWRACQPSQFANLLIRAFRTWPWQISRLLFVRISRNRSPQFVALIHQPLQSLEASSLVSSPSLSFSFACSNRAKLLISLEIKLKKKYGKVLESR